MQKSMNNEEFRVLIGDISKNTDGTLSDRGWEELERVIKEHKAEEFTSVQLMHLYNNIMKCDNMLNGTREDKHREILRTINCLRTAIRLGAK